MSNDYTSIEDLLLATLDAVSRELPTSCAST